MLELSLIPVASFPMTHNRIRGKKHEIKFGTLHVNIGVRIICFKVKITKSSFAYTYTNLTDLLFHITCYKCAHFSNSIGKIMKLKQKLKKKI